MRDAIVTIDAMGCQKKIAAAIVDKGADYLLALKDNQPNLHADVEAAFAPSAPTDDRLAPVDVFTTEEKGHGRREFRRVSVRAAAESLTGFEEWSSLTSNAETAARAIRGH